MIRAAVEAELNFERRAFYVSVARASDRFLVSTPEGAAVVLNHRLSAVARLHVSRTTRDIALASGGARVVVADGDALSVWEVASGARTAEVSGNFDGCTFVRDGLLVCSSRRLSRDTLAVEVRTTAKLELVARSEIVDPFGDSDCRFFQAPHADYAFIWIAAGQDGQALRTIRVAGDQLMVSPFTDLVETGPPAFSPDGKSMLLVHAFTELNRYSFPNAELQSSFRWPDESVSLETAEFITAEAALVSTGDGRMYLVDLAASSILDEVEVPGHEPRPIGKLYPSIHTDEVVSDLDSFAVLGDRRVVSAHRQLPASDQDWRDSLIVWHIA